MHTEDHPLAGKTVRLGIHPFCEGGGVEHDARYTIENWVDRMPGNKSWMDMEGNPAALKYAMRVGNSVTVLPIDDEVVYGKINGLGHMIHVQELREVIER